MENFQLLHSSLICDKIPVSEYISIKSGLTVVIAETDGPVVKGFFCTVTETFDDVGLPHIMEHVLFCGSEKYPYKRALNLFAKRCLGLEVYASSDSDNVCYIMETAGSEGFLSLMPIFLDYIFHPLLSEESFITEVHHITGEGKDAGLVYTEMDDCDYGYPRIDLIVARIIYPGRCGYSSETCGLSKNIRESANIIKVREFHKQFHRPENLKIIITGQIKSDEVFKSLAEIEEKITSEGDSRQFQNPWQNPPPPLTESKDVIVKYRSDEEENNGVFCIAWRIGSVVTDSYTVMAMDILLQYLVHSSVSPIRKDLVDTEPYAPAGVSQNLKENSDTCASITFHDVPISKLPEIKTELQNMLKKIVENEDIDMNGIEDMIRDKRLDMISILEKIPHIIASSIITPYMIYGNIKEDFQDQMNPQRNLDKLLKEPKAFWLNLLQKYLVDNKYVAVQCLPSKEEQAKTVKEEAERIKTQIQRLTEFGLKEKSVILDKAIKFNEREPPIDIITSIPVPTLNSVKFHNILRYSTDSDQKQPIDLSKTPIFTYFDNLKTHFVHIYAILDTTSVPTELRIYLPLLLKSLLKLSVERNGKIIPYDKVATQLKNDTDYNATSLGVERDETCQFECDNYSQTCVVMLNVEADKYETGIGLLKELLYKTVFTAERLKATALEINSNMAEFKTNGRNMAPYAVNRMCFSEDSNMIKSGVIHQNKFLVDLIEKLDSSASKEVLENMENLRKIITNPTNVVLYIAGDLDYLKNPVRPISEFVPSEFIVMKNQQKLNPTPDYKLLKHRNLSLDGCIIAIDKLESSYFCQTTRSITSYTDPDLPALMLYLQYLIESPEWKQIRDKNYSYTRKIMVQVNKGLLYLIYEDANNITEAYRVSRNIATKLLMTKEWNNFLLQTARNSLIFDVIDARKTINSAIYTSILSYFHNEDYNYYRTFLDLVDKVTIEDLNRVGEKYVEPLFDSNKIKTAIMADPSKVTEIADGFKKLGLNLTVYSSVEESFLNTL